ncbi:MAG: Lrp/AsnC family transcriptional regulator [Eubacterium sp.]|nr:Lrp/AsnC family transcriptional regulator [Eubacterium sp.]MBR4241903.1 Lrp/AsnC family transcriptional regulator [Eubacterium sp.]
MEKLLSILEMNPRLSNEEIAIMLGISEQEVKSQIAELENSGIIKGYRAIIDKDKTDNQTVTALIEIQVHPKYDHGFEEIAEKISNFSEVESVYLMSGGYDLCCLVNNKTFQEVAMFVAKRLSTLEDVISTKTNFILKRYKEQDVILFDSLADDRGTISL